MPTPPERILIVRMSAFGDIICALPTLRAVRASFPEAHIGWVVDSRFESLISQDPAIDQLFVVSMGDWSKRIRNPAQWPRLISEHRALKRELREAQFDVCLDLQGLLKSALIVRAAAARRTYQMAGGRTGRKRWLAPGVRVPCENEHAVTRMLPLAAAIGADISNPRSDVHIPRSDRDHAQALFAAHDFGASGPVVALNPGAAREHRMWPADRFAQAARRLRDEIDARIVVLGGPGEVDLADSIVSASGVEALSTAGKTSLMQLAGVLDLCDALVTGDTGPQHLAAALGKHVVALFGPANPARTGPFGDGHIVIQKPFDCQFCYAHPTCEDYACMSAIEVDEVVGAVKQVLA